MKNNYLEEDYVNRSSHLSAIANNIHNHEDLKTSNPDLWFWAMSAFDRFMNHRAIVNLNEMEIHDLEKSISEIESIIQEKCEILIKLISKLRPKLVQDIENDILSKSRFLIEQYKSLCNRNRTGHIYEFIILPLTDYVDRYEYLMERKAEFLKERKKVRRLIISLFDFDTKMLDDISSKINKNNLKPMTTITHKHKKVNIRKNMKELASV